MMPRYRMFGVLALLFCLLILSRSSVQSGIPQPCDWTAVTNGGVMVACPRTQCGTSLADIDAVIIVIIRDTAGLPIEGMPASDIWLIGAEDNLFLCGGQYSLYADSPTNESGMTTISGTFTTGGCSNGVLLVVQGIIAVDPVDCVTPLILPIAVRSADCSGDGGIPDGVVDLMDLGAISAHYTSPPKAYEECFDFDGNGCIDLIDMSLFSSHYYHQCGS